MNPLIHLKHQVLFSLKNNEKIFMNVVCCSCDWRLKGETDIICSQCIFDFEIRKKQMFTEARAFSRVTYFLFSGEPAGFFLKLT